MNDVAVASIAKAFKKGGLETPEEIREFLIERPDIEDELEELVTGIVAPIPRRWEMCKRYGNDPVGFARDVLREYVTPQCAEFMSAVAKYDFVTAQSCNGSGKTHSMGALALWGLMCHEGAQVYLLAAGDEQNLRRLLWSSVQGRISRKPGLLNCIGNAGTFRQKDLLIQKYSGHNGVQEWIQGVIIPQTSSDEDKIAKTSGKHAPFLMFLVDEADAVPDAIFDGIEMCMSSQNIKLVASFNPRKRSGRVYDMIVAKTIHVCQLDAFHHPNVIRGRDVVPGAVSRDVTIRRINESSEPIDARDRDGSCFEVPEFLVGTQTRDSAGRMYPPLQAGWRKITDIMFAPMVLGTFSPLGDSTAVFNRPYLTGVLTRCQSEAAKWDMMRAGDGLRGDLHIFRAPDMKHRYVVLADPAEGRKASNGDYSEADIFDCATEEQVAHYTGRPDPAEFAGDLAAIGAHYNSAEVCVERNNHGHAVLLALVQINGYSPVYKHEDGSWGYPITEKSKAYLDGMLAAKFNEAHRTGDGLILHYVPSVEQCLNYVRKDGGKREAAGNGHDDCVSTLRLAVEMLQKQQRGWTTEWKPPAPVVMYGSRTRTHTGGRN